MEFSFESLMLFAHLSEVLNVEHSGTDNINVHV